MGCLLLCFRYFLIKAKFFRAIMANDEILTIHELSAYLKLNEKTAYRLAAKGDIPGFKVGGSWRFRTSEIDRWIKQKEKQYA
jgi:excisionase family DNA binding protein